MITLRGVPLRVELSFEYLGSGRSRGEFRGARPPPLILDQTEARRAEKMSFGDRLPPPPLSQGLDQALLGGDLLPIQVSEKKKSCKTCKTL